MKSVKLYFGYYCFFSFIFNLLAFLPFFFDFAIENYGLLVSGWVSGIILFFWMTYNLITNKNLQYKFIWFLSFCIMFLGVITYFWFVYRKTLNTK